MECYLCDFSSLTISSNGGFTTLLLVVLESRYSVLFRINDNLIIVLLFPIDSERVICRNVYLHVMNAVSI